LLTVESAEEGFVFAEILGYFLAVETNLQPALNQQ
jgi:hypothetical protein